MQAYHGSQEYKDQFVRLLDQHAIADRVTQGAYWSDGKGCAVGCSIESMRVIAGLPKIDRSAHELYEEFIGVPRILARLEDGIFEGLPVETARTWPVRFAAAIRPGADLSGVWPRFAVWLLVDVEDGIIRFAKNDRQRAAIQRVADLYQQKIEGADIPASVWRADAYAAAAADAYAADAAAYAAAAYAAYAADAYAAYAAADAAAYAAYAAADAAAYAAADAAAYAAARTTAREQARIKQADKLIALLEAA